jgi:hypothetical protein
MTIPPVILPASSMLEHADLLYLLASTFLGIICFLIWRQLVRMETAIEKLFDLFLNITEKNLEVFATKEDVKLIREDLKEIKDDRREKWNLYFTHTHKNNEMGPKN